jgi:hypothetical protein
MTPLVIIDLQERDEEDEEIDDDEHENEGLLKRFANKFTLLLLLLFVDDEVVDGLLPAHNLTVCLDLRIKFSGNLNETLRTLPTQCVNIQLVMLQSLRLLVFSIIIY